MKAWPKFACLLVLLGSAIILLGANADGASGCAPPPELTVGKPQSGENVPTTPVSIEFNAKQGTPVKPL